MKRACVVLLWWSVAVSLLACGEQDAGVAFEEDEPIHDELPDEEPEPEPEPEPMEEEPEVEGPVVFDWLGELSVGALYAAHATKVWACNPEDDACPAGMHCEAFAGDVGRFDVGRIPVDGWACTPDTPGLGLDMNLALPAAGQGEHNVSLEFTLDQEPIPAELAQEMSVSVFKTTLQTEAYQAGSSVLDLKLDSGLYSVFVDLPNSEPIYLGWRGRGALSVRGSGAVVIDLPTRPVLMRTAKIMVDGEPAPGALLVLYAQDGSLCRLSHDEPGRVREGRYRAELSLEGHRSGPPWFPVGPYAVGDVVVDEAPEGVIEIEIDFVTVSGTVSLDRGNSSWDGDMITVGVIDVLNGPNWWRNIGVPVPADGGDFTVRLAPGIYDFYVSGPGVGDALVLEGVEINADVQHLELNTEIVPLAGELTVNGERVVDGHPVYLTIGNEYATTPEDGPTFSMEVFTGTVSVSAGPWSLGSIEVSEPVDDFVINYDYGVVFLDNPWEALSQTISQKQKVSFMGLNSWGAATGARRLASGSYHVDFYQSPVDGGIDALIPLGHTRLGEVVVDGEQTLALEPEPGLVVRGQLDLGFVPAESVAFYAVQAMQTNIPIHNYWQIPVSEEGGFEVALGEGLWQLRVGCLVPSCLEFQDRLGPLTDWFQVAAPNTVSEGQ